jgi:hypothetical protein
MNRFAVSVNGENGLLIDLSISGAQVQSPTRLRPMKIGRLILPDPAGDLKLRGTVAWAIAVPTEGTLQYRAGIEFVNPDKKTLSAFCSRHGGTPDPTLSTA